jgi:hypothetical protein
MIFLSNNLTSQISLFKRRINNVNRKKEKEQIKL